MATVSAKLSRADRTYKTGETVSGYVEVISKGSLSHNGISLHLEGEVTLQLSAKSVGVFEAFYNSLKPIKLIDYKIDIAKAGKLPDGKSQLPFEFVLNPLPEQQLYETYHGVFVTCVYSLTVDIVRPLLAKHLQSKVEFIVEVDSDAVPKDQRIEFTASPEQLENSALSKIPNFIISGSLVSAVCEINKPVLGEITVLSCDSPIRSIELQLVRVETCGCAEGYAKELTEIQNLQICDGDVARGLTIPIYMIFPRLFTCPSVSARTFKIQFELNVVVMFKDGYVFSQNIPIVIVRKKGSNY